MTHKWLTSPSHHLPLSILSQNPRTNWEHGPPPGSLCLCSYTMLGTSVPLFKGLMVYVQKQQPDNFQITAEDQKTQHEGGAEGKMVFIQASVETAFESSLEGWGRQGCQQRPRATFQSGQPHLSSVLRNLRTEARMHCWKKEEMRLQSCRRKWQRVSYSELRNLDFCLVGHREPLRIFKYENIVLEVSRSVFFFVFYHKFT